MNSSLRATLKRLSENYGMEEEDEEVELEEMNVTSNLDGGLGQPSTPYAFSKKVQVPDDEAYSEDVPDTNRFFKQINDIYIKALNELNYKTFKTDDTKTERQKINSNIMEINRTLREVERMISHASKLKTESGADQTVYWKGTLGSFNKIKERLNRLSNKIVEMQGG